MGDSIDFHTNAMLDFITSAMRAKGRDDIIAGLAKATADYGMDNFAISGVPAPNERIDPYFMLNGWPEGWFEHYAAENFIHVDPVVNQTMQADDAFVWSEALAGKKMSKASRRVMGEASEVRMCDGFSVPLYGISGLKAIVSFSAPKIELSPEARGTLQIISIYAHNRLRALIAEGESAAFRKSLSISSREREILHWCAAGKTNWEIGEILTISAKTVQNHLANLCRKFDVVNRAQLVAEAFRNGIIR